MDRDALKRALQDRFQQSVDEALAAVAQAPDGRWIAASEWEVREIFQKLMGDCYRQMLQARCDAAAAAAAAAAGAAFSPGGGRAGPSARTRGIGAWTC
jgi:hypothetical protein